jgi:hypothetical protein
LGNFGRLRGSEAGVPYRDERRLPLLEDLRIAKPCDASWHAMAGDDRVRFCHRCGKDVYNLAAMTRKEAEILLADAGGSLCASLFQRADGTVITSDCPEGVRLQHARRARLAAAVAGTIAAAGAAALAVPHATARSLEPTHELVPAHAAPPSYMLQHTLGFIGGRMEEPEEAPEPPAGAIPRRRRPVPKLVRPKP